MSTFRDANLVEIDYETVRLAMQNKPFTMSLVGITEISAIVGALNMGIDSHLESCYVPERGDKYEIGKREVNGVVIADTLECTISVESLPILLRRLQEGPFTFPVVADEALSLQSDILHVLGIN